MGISQFWTWVLCISESSMPLLTCSLAWCPPSPPALHFSLHSRIHLPLKTIKSFQQRLEPQGPSRDTRNQGRVWEGPRVSPNGRGVYK